MLKFKSSLNGVKRIFTNGNIGLYAYEGLLIALVVNLINNNNNLFATRLGASDYQLSLIQLIPQILNMLILFPGGIITDSLKNKRSMVIISIAVTGVLYFVIGFVPLLPVYRFFAFLMLLAISSASITLYNLSWQSYFSEVMPVNHRNKALTVRSYVSVFVGIITPLVTGNILARMPNQSMKIMAHQGYFFAASVLIIWQIRILLRINAENPPAPRKIDMKAIKAALTDLFKNKQFVVFCAVAIFFYMTWHMDWTLYFIGQTKYLKLDESFLGFAIVGNTLMQFITLRFWSKMNERKGVVFPMVFGILGLASLSLVMVISTAVPLAIGRYLFLLLFTGGCFAMATIGLNLFQCLLQVLKDDNKTLSISIYTTFVCLSNAVMPVVGVTIYKSLGGDLRALQITMLIAFVLRLFAAGLWILRLKMMKKNKA